MSARRGSVQSRNGGGDPRSAHDKIRREGGLVLELRNCAFDLKSLWNSVAGIFPHYCPDVVPYRLLTRADHYTHNTCMYPVCRRVVSKSSHGRVGRRGCAILRHVAPVLLSAQIPPNWRGHCTRKGGGSQKAHGRLLRPPERYDPPFAKSWPAVPSARIVVSCTSHAV